MYEAGSAKVEIPTYYEGLGMLGYGRDFNKMKGRLSKLFVRAYCFKSPETDDRFYFVNAELCFTTAGVKREVLNRLHERDPGGNYTDANIMITSQHTHSAPGGFAHHPFYNFPVPGFRPKIFNEVCEALTRAILQSGKELKKVNLYFGSGEFESDIQVGFNRSLKAYNANKDVNHKKKHETHLAIDRTMDLLRVDDENGDPLGQINWFGVHTTSLGNRINKISSDNKGYASGFFEEEIGNGFNAIFAQQIAGDVSPNFHGKLGLRIKMKWKKKGPHKDDVENAKFNGRLQYYKAKEIWEDTVKNKPVSGSIESELVYVDFSDIQVDPDFAYGRQDAFTVSACHGVSFFAGTPVDGPGMPQGVKQFAMFCSDVIKYGEYLLAAFRNQKYKEWVKRKYKAQGKKKIIFETGRGVVYGTRQIKHFFIPGFFDGGIKEMKHQHRMGALRETPWTPHVLPIQIVKLGNVALAGFPGEITTTGGLRLKRMLEKELAAKGIEHVVVCSYANNYMGYCTTEEEYATQCYEGGHTVFGQWTHGAFMTEFRKLCREFLKPVQERKLDRTVTSHVFSEKEMNIRSYD